MAAKRAMTIAAAPALVAGGSLQSPRDAFIHVVRVICLRWVSGHLMRRTPLGVRALAAFFVFGACMSLLAFVGLLFPGAVLEPMWQLNPRARETFVRMGPWALVLLGVVGTTCALSASGLLARSSWGYRLALAVLTVNLVGDTANAILRDDQGRLSAYPLAVC